VLAVADEAGDFRFALDAFVEDFLRLRRRIQGRERVPSLPTPMEREEYQALRRRVADAYRGVEEPFAEFVRSEPEHDLAGAPITSWWRALTLDEALDAFQAADDGQLRAELHRQHAVLDGFADWSNRRPERAGTPEAPSEPTAATKGSWLNNEWVVGVGVTTIGGLIVVLIVYVVSH
jgi:hypothetical protein